MPTIEQIHAAAGRLPEASRLEVLDVSERAAVIAGLDNEQPRYYLQHALGFQIHDEQRPHQAQCARIRSRVRASRGTARDSARRAPSIGVSSRSRPNVS